MKINCEVDTSLLDKNVKRYAKNLAYSTAQALNDTAKAAQSQIRANLRTAFHVRQAAFLDRSIKIFAFASVGALRPYAELGVDNKPRFLLSMFEQGGARLPFVGRNVAVPITGQAARPSIESPVRADLTFHALDFTRGRDNHGPQKRGKREYLAGRRVASNASSYNVWYGNQRTFILPHSRAAPLGGVFQRIGPKREDVRLIYSFKSNVRLRAALGFVATTERTFQQVFREAFFRHFYRLNP